MYDHAHLIALNERSLAQQAAVRRATFSPQDTKRLRPFSIWEMSQFMFGVPADTLRKKLAEDPSLPQGEVLGGWRAPTVVYPGGDQRDPPPCAVPGQVPVARAPRGRACALP